jgi:glycosyltransferase involved in cell wall biosynthesis
MKIYINGRFLAAPVTGVQRYGRELLRELDLILAGSDGTIRAEILLPKIPADIPEYRAISVRKVGRLKGHSWEQLELPFYCRGHLLFTPSSAAPLLHNANVVTIHDTAIFSAPHGYSPGYRLWYKVLGWVLCRTALKVLTVSEFSKHELLRWCCPSAEKVAVIYEGSEHARSVEADPVALAKFGLGQGKYIFAVGSKNPNKNFRGLARALPYLKGQGYDIAVAGNTDDPVFRHCAAQLKDVRDLGYVTDAELRALYEGAACFVFPSFYEGFGLPPLEALALGCNVVVSDRASMPEVFAGLATFCNPDDPADIAEKILSSIRNSNRGAGSTDLLMEKIAKFSWKACARDTWKILESCLSFHAETARGGRRAEAPLPTATQFRPIDKS